MLLGTPEIFICRVFPDNMDCKGSNSPEILGSRCPVFPDMMMFSNFGSSSAPPKFSYVAFIPDDMEIPNAWMPGLNWYF